MPPAKHNCSHSELTTRVVALEAGLEAFKELMKERDERYKQRSESQDEAVASALMTSEKAIAKAETATERRLEGLNELRDMASDQSKTYARADEVKLLIDALQQKIGFLDELVKSQIARGTGMKDAWGYLAVTGGLVIGALAIYFRHGG